MDWTDVYYRNLARLMTKRTWLYTEMIVDKTLIHKSDYLDKFLKFPAAQHPIVLQLGGNKVSELGDAVKLAASYGYDEINLNCGCPSPRVSGKGCFGAALMKEPPTVRSIVNEMKEFSPVPVTIKCRLGVDDNDTYPELVNFVRETSEDSSTNHYIMHARKAFLQGLSPAQNRNVPPLKYDWVYKLSEDFPHLKFSLNGGVQTIEEAKELLERRGEGGGKIHGVMIGRAAYQRPWHTLGSVDTEIFGESENPSSSRRQVINEYAELCDKQIDSQCELFGCERKHVLRKMVKPLLGLFYKEPGAQKWRTQITSSLDKDKPSCVSEVVEKGMACVPDQILDAGPGVEFTSYSENGQRVIVAL